MNAKAAEELTAGDVVMDREIIREARQNCPTIVRGDIRVVRGVRLGRKYAYITMGNFAVAKALRGRMVDLT